ncbi:MAG TPA: STAS domain-containing protein [bacterium]|nr:STAS domain-containing protein [bacterium]
MPNPSDGKEPAPGFSTNIFRLTTDVAVLELHGELDCYTQVALPPALEAVGEINLVIDFRGLRYMGADALPAFLKAYQRRAVNGGRIALVVCSDQSTIRKVLRIWFQHYKLSEKIGVYPDTESALTALAINP